MEAFKEVMEKLKDQLTEARQMEAIWQKNVETAVQERDNHAQRCKVLHDAIRTLGYVIENTAPEEVPL